MDSTHYFNENGAAEVGTNETVEHFLAKEELCCTNKFERLVLNDPNVENSVEEIFLSRSAFDCTASSYQ